MEAELNRLDLPLVFTRLLHEALFAISAFTCFNEGSPYNALFGRQPAMLPDLPTSRWVSVEVIAQATAIAHISRALRTRTTFAGQHYFNEGDLVVYHRLTTRKDDWGGWNGPFPVVRNDPDRGQ
eukprot:2263008-Pyramimonas_sp.AAC.1